MNENEERLLKITKIANLYFSPISQIEITKKHIFLHFRDGDVVGDSHEHFRYKLITILSEEYALNNISRVVFFESIKEIDAILP